MTYDLLLAVTGFALASVITPGPNNVMLMASGANFGLRRSWPHMAGVATGVPLMILPVGFGVMAAFEAWPALRTLLTVAAALYMLWLAWKITQASAPGSGEARARPLTYLQAAAFQWINPKAWTMVLASITLYAPDRSLASLLWISGAFLAVGAISTNLWVLVGQQVRRWLSSPLRLRLFNGSMAALLVASMIPALLQ